MLGKLLKSVPLVEAAGGGTWRRYRQWKDNPERRIGKALGGKLGLLVVQIGSNDGSTGDPIHTLLSNNPSWRALLIEPIPFLFQRLRRNYPQDVRFCFENIAIAEAEGCSPFYYIDPAAKEFMPDLPYWYDQLGSFDRGHIARHFGDKLDKFIVKIDIPTSRLSTVLQRNNISQIDLLHIDTEGYDWNILRQLDLKLYAPKVILFEHKHLSTDEIQQARAFLIPAYKMIDLGCDFFCQRLSR
jgi:FkbM family methyltransferase